MFYPKTWSSWDSDCINAIMKVPELAELRIAFYNTNSKKITNRLLWNSVTKVYDRSLDGTYFKIDMKFEELCFNMEFASREEAFVLKITPLSESKNIKFFIYCTLRWNREGLIEKREDSFIISSQEFSYTISAEGDIDRHTPVNSMNAGILFSSSNIINITCNFNTSDNMDKFILERKAAWEEEKVCGGGVLANAPEAVVAGMNWNTIYEPIKDRFCSPVTKKWCNIDDSPWCGAYVLFTWDTYLDSLLAAVQNKDFAYAQVYSIIDEMTQDNSPQCAGQHGALNDRSNPPVGSYCVLKLYRQFGEVELINNTFEKLYKWNLWWMPHRDGNTDGLLEWGSDGHIGDAKIGHSNLHREAADESGLDNSPVFDGVQFNRGARTLELADIGLNSLYAMDCWALYEMANIIGKSNEAKILKEEYERIKTLVNTELWNEEKGIYCNKHWNGELSDRYAPTCFYPLIAGIAPLDRAKRIINEHLLNEKEFWGEFVIPSIARNDAAFEDNDYWRGRVWAPMNFLVAEGLKRYNFLDVADQLAYKGLDLFLREWNEESHIHENYNSVDGEGDDVYNAEPLYTWGGLLGQIAIASLVDVQAWGGVRFGNLSGKHSSIKNITIGTDLYSVELNSGIKITKNGLLYIETNNPAIITIEKVERSCMYVEIQNNCPLEVSFNIDMFKEDIKNIKINTVNKVYDAILDENGKVKVVIE